MDASQGYTGQHFPREIDQINKDLEDLVDHLMDAGLNRAQAEHDYRVSLAKKIWVLRAQKVPVTIVSDLARGDEEVALLKLKRDSDDSDYWTTQEAINVEKLKLKTVNDQVSREWGRPSNM